MREHFVGRTPRLTGYLCGITLGLACLVAGAEATRLVLVGSLSTPAFVGYVAIGAVSGLFLSFVTGYLNGSILASWLAGFVPAAGRLGKPLADGLLFEAGLTLVGALGAGIMLGTVGFVIAVEKHRWDARTASLPDPASRGDLLVLVIISGALGGALFATPALSYAISSGL
ncbi:MAG: hypothetical protein ACI8UR_002096 [Natronomonas sp.]|jgi:hypothetical protein|uniref:hypothetical protein n=1 Tax=Natronomonas sp. TaxID=2184060 RepID=UPI00398964EF